MIEKSIRINNVMSNTRLALPPMRTGLAGKNGEVTEELCRHYAERSYSGGPGIVIVEHAFVRDDGRASADMLSVSRDSDIPGLSRLAASINKGSALAVAQINHAGSMAIGEKIISASEVANPRNNSNRLPEEIPFSEIDNIKTAYVEAAVRVKQAGFDGVEIHSAHAYLLNQFYSPLTNRRNDKYGAGSIENRIRLLREIYTGIRKSVGNDYMVSVRLGGEDTGMAGGSSIEDAVEACRILEQDGVDLLNISGGMCGYMLEDKGPGYFREMTAAIKREVSVPVILTGGIRTKADAECLLTEGYADMIGIGRPMLNNPNWIKNEFS